MARMKRPKGWRPKKGEKVWVPAIIHGVRLREGAQPSWVTVKGEGSTVEDWIDFDEAQVFPRQ